MTINGDIDTEYFTLNGNDACRLTYVATTQGVTLKLTQVIIVKNSKAYILTLGSFVPDFEEFKPKMEKMISSFK